MIGVVLGSMTVWVSAAALTSVGASALGSYPW